MKNNWTIKLDDIGFYGLFYKDTLCTISASKGMIEFFRDHLNENKVTLPGEGANVIEFRRAK